MTAKHDDRGEQTPSSARKESFPPVVTAAVRVLVLGSLPGERSLAHRQYYAHPTNQFWRLLGAVIARPLADMAYADRLEALLAARIGLWDTIASATRRGSLDGAIRDPAPNSLAMLVSQLPDLRLIAFNGATAARAGLRQWPGHRPPVAHVVLPSSSAAHASLSFDDKRDRWIAALAGALAG